MAEKNEIKRVGSFGNIITLHFSEEPNPLTEEKVMGVLVESYENRMDSTQDNIDNKNDTVV